MSTTKLNIHRCIPSTQAEGPGRRCCVWLQGCSRHCKGCFAPDTWDPAPRMEKMPHELIDLALRHSVEGITVLGGEPFEQPIGLAQLLSLAWAHQLSTIVFTGFTLENLQCSDNDDIHTALQHTDVLIDGPYVEEMLSSERPMVGSSNQRFIFLTDRYQMPDFKPNKIEVRIQRNGTAIINGMGREEQLRKILDIKKEKQP